MIVTPRPVWIPAAVAIAALVLAIVNSAFSVGFPAGSAVDFLYNLGISIDLLVIAVLLGAAAVLRWRRRALGVTPGGHPAAPVILRDGVPESTPLSRLGQIPAGIGAVLSAVAITAWTLLSGIPIFAALALDEPLRYMNSVAGAFFFGIPLVLGVVLSTLSLRPDSLPRQRLLAGVGLGLGLLLIAPQIVAAALHASGSMS